MKIGIVGLGNLGGTIGRRLIEHGVQISVYDKNPVLVDEFVHLGADGFSNSKELATETDTIITVLPNANIVRDVILGEEGLVDGLKPGSTIIEMSTSIPAVTTEVGEELEKQGVDVIDAPVSGGVVKAKTGELSIMVGGEQTVLEKVEPLLNRIGNKIIHVGELGSGHAVKTINNLLCATTLGATSEALVLGAKMGIDPEKTLEVINKSSGRSYSSEYKFPQQVLNRKFDKNFTIDLMYKDIQIALLLAEQEDLNMRISKAVSDLWKEGKESIGDLDHTAIVKIIEKEADIEVESVNKSRVK